MKRNMVVLLALVMGFMYSSLGIVALAEEKPAEVQEDVTEDKETEADLVEEEGSFINNLFGNLFSVKEEKEPVCEASGLKNLQIPEKLDVVIDPWEIDRKGQIYSEQYTICNTGEMTGILTLSSLTCRPREQSGVIIRTDKEGLHDSGDKSIYIEMLFGNGERIIFSSENSQYQTELKPGEELSICFAGEVNENALGKWENDDIAVSVVYSWEMEEKPDDVDMKDNVKDSEENLQTDGNEKKAEKNLEEAEEELQAEGNLEGVEEEPQAEGNLKGVEEEPQAEENLKETEEKEQKEDPEEKPENDADAEKLQEQQGDTRKSESEKEMSDDTETGIEQQPSADLPAGEVNGQETSETTGKDMQEGNPEAVTQEGLQSSESHLGITEKEEEEIKNIELRETQKVDVAIDSWKIDEQGRIVSSKYMLQNAGDTVGTWSLSELICKAKEQSGIRICTDKKEMQGSNEKSVYLELVLGNGKKTVVSQENSQYEVELKPGETLSVQFVGEMNGNLFEKREDGDIAVTAICTWNVEQIAAE